MLLCHPPSGITTKAPYVEKPAESSKFASNISSVATVRTLANAGMGASMGALVRSAMIHWRKPVLSLSKRAMRYHTLAEVALLGFAVWNIAHNKIYEE